MLGPGGTLESEHLKEMQESHAWCSGLYSGGWGWGEDHKFMVSLGTLVRPCHSKAETELDVVIQLLPRIPQ